MTAREYNYSVDAAGNIRAASGEFWTPTGKVLLDGVRKTTWLGPFDACERDLLRVMAGCLFDGPGRSDVIPGLRHATPRTLRAACIRAARSRAARMQSVRGPCGNRPERTLRIAPPDGSCDVLRGGRTAGSIHVPPVCIRDREVLRASTSKVDPSPAPTSKGEQT